MDLVKNINVINNLLFIRNKSVISIPQDQIDIVTQEAKDLVACLSNEHQENLKKQEEKK